MVSGPLLEAPAGLLARWGIPADAELTRAESGCNNQTFAVAYGGGRWVLRISQNLSAAQARAEHRLLGRLRTADLPFGVPEPVAALSGDTVAETPAGPATLCRWIPGVRPDLAADPALERFGRAIGLLSRALQPVTWSDAPQDWRGDPLRAQSDAPRPCELAGPDVRVQDLLVGLLLSGALAGPGWARRAAALVRGYAAVLRLGQAEIMAVPDLLVTRCVGSVFWRAGRWRRGQSGLSDVADRVAVLEASQTWLAVHRGRLLSVLAQATSLQALLEPVVRVGLVVEGRYLAVAGRPVQRDRLGQCLVGLQPQHPDPVRRSPGLELGQQPAAEAEAADRGRDPHPLDPGNLGGRAGVELQRAAADRLPAQRRDQEQSRGRGHLVGGRRDAPGRVEAAVEAPGQLVHVGPQAAPGIRVPRIAHAGHDGRGVQQPLHLRHGGDEPATLPLAQRPEQRDGGVVGETVELGTFGLTGDGEPRRPDPPVRLVRLDGDQPVPFQRPQQPAQVAGVQVQPRPQVPDVAAVRADLPQHPGLPQRAATGQERVVERAGPLGDGPVEPPDLVDHRPLHIL